jgi:hypothetical protein
MTEITTTNLADFGARERSMLIDLLVAWREQGLPRDFDLGRVVPMMNTNSGNVFLTNEEFQVAMMNGDKLESFYSCPICGHEGFAEDMEHNSDDNIYNEECQQYLADIRRR